MPLPKNQNEKYTYKDYLTWPGEERWELIDGVPYMQAAPSWEHQSILGEILTQFNNYLRDKQCKVFSAPFDLRLPDKDEKDEDVATVLQPDILIVCDKSKLQGTGYYGVPTLIIEIVSPSTNKVDKLSKFNKYEKTGVQEYWVIEPESKLVSVFILQDNKRYGRPDVYSEENNINISVFPGLTVELKFVFAY
jgi:Uma2 family endonuclease